MKYINGKSYKWYQFKAIAQAVTDLEKQRAKEELEAKQAICGHRWIYSQDVPRMPSDRHHPTWTMECDICGKIDKLSEEAVFLQLAERVDYEIDKDYWEYINMVKRNPMSYYQPYELYKKGI